MYRQLPSCHFCGRVSKKNVLLFVVIIILMALVTYSNNEQTQRPLFQNDFTKKLDNKAVNWKSDTGSDVMKDDVIAEEKTSKHLQAAPVKAIHDKEKHNIVHAQNADAHIHEDHVQSPKEPVQIRKVYDFVIRKEPEKILQEPEQIQKEPVQIHNEPAQIHKEPDQTIESLEHIKDVPVNHNADTVAKGVKEKNKRRVHHKARAHLRAKAKASARVRESKLARLKKANPDLTDRAVRKFEILGRTDMFEEDRTCKQQLPDALIIGVMKAGTEAFSTYLTINPDVAMSVNVRSTLFFTRNYHKGLDWYKSQMTCSTNRQVTVEKAPQYFSEPHVPSRIHAMNKRIKLILLVRNPIDRAISHYLQVKSSHPKTIGGRSFEDLVFTKHNEVRAGIGFIALSRYSEILHRWYQYFSSHQILVLDGDMFKKDQIKVLSKAEQFLGIKNYITSDRFIYDKEKGFYCLNVNGESACLGDGKGRTHPALKDVHYRKLKEYFKPYNHALYKMTGKNFHW